MKKRKSDEYVFSLHKKTWVIQISHKLSELIYFWRKLEGNTYIINLRFIFLYIGNPNVRQGGGRLNNRLTRADRPTRPPAAEIWPPRALPPPTADTPFFQSKQGFIAARISIIGQAVHCSSAPRSTTELHRKINQPKIARVMVTLGSLYKVISLGQNLGPTSLAVGSLSWSAESHRYFVFFLLKIWLLKPTNVIEWLGP